MMLRVAIDASGGVGVGVRFLDRNREVDVGAVHAAATTAIRAGWEDGLGAKAVLSNESPHVTDTVRGEIEPERSLTEQLSELRGLANCWRERGQTVGRTERIEDRERSRRGRRVVASSKLRLGDNKLRLGVTRQHGARVAAGIPPAREPPACGVEAETEIRAGRPRGIR